MIVLNTLICIAMFIFVFYMKRVLDRSILNDYTLFIGPYFAILFINNFIMTRVTNFYEISASAINAITIAIVTYGMGSIIGSMSDSGKIKMWFKFGSAKELNIFEESSWRIKSATRYTWIVLAIQGTDFLYRIMKYGLSAISQHDFELMQISGISGHLFLTLYAVVPINLYESIEKKYQKGIMSAVVAIIFTFLTFVKYNVITIVLLTALYFIVRDRKNIIKVGVAALITVVVAFIGNYIVLFVTQGFWGKDVIVYTLEHLWLYIVCGVAMMNYSIGNMAIHYTFMDFFIDSIAALPNMILFPVLGIRISSSSVGFKGFLSVPPSFTTDGSHIGNAVSVLTGLYSTGENVIGFAVVMIIMGFLCSKIMNRAKYNNINTVSLTGVLFMTYLLISFFGNYWTLSTPWEILVYSVVIPMFFDSKHRIRIRLGSVQNRKMVTR